MKTIIYFFLLLQFSLSGLGQNCNSVPKHFSSYESAIAYIKKAEFKFKDEVNTSKSSWIRSASFYSCDGKTGYFIFGTDTKEYIHVGMPIDIWTELKMKLRLGHTTTRISNIDTNFI